VIPRHFQIMISLLLVAILLVGIYIIQLRRGEQQIAQRETTAPTVLQGGGSVESIHILVAYDDDQALRWRDAETFMPEDRSLRAKAAMKAVLDQYLQKPSPHPVGKGAAIKDVYFIGTDTLLVDTTAAFADEHPPGILLEEMTLASLIETLSANVPGIARVKFLVDGKERETLAGHADLMSFYQVSAVHELVKELQ
jgi:Sporulation and spore germination